MAQINEQGLTEKDIPVQPTMEFDLPSWANEQGVKIVGKQDEDNFILEGQGGDRVAFNLSDYIKSEGGDPAQFKYKATDIDAPFEQRPPSLSGSDMVTTRFLSSLGNEKGTVGKLQSQFGKDAVKVNTDGRIVVRDKDNEWYPLDPKTLGIGSTSDKAWELASDIGEHANDVVVRTAAAIKGAAVGATTGAAIGSVVPGVGTVAGGIVGGIVGAAGGGFIAEAGTRQILGRVAGTYDADLKESVQDLGFESLLAAGGQTVSVGARPALKQLVKGAKFIGSKTNRATKAIAAEVFGVANGTGTEATQILLDNADDVGKAISKHFKGAVNYNKGAQSVKTEQIDELGKLLGIFDKKNSAVYRANLARTVAQAEQNGLKVHAGEMIDDVVKQFEADGLIKSIRTEDGVLKGITASKDLMKVSPHEAKQTVEALKEMLHLGKKGSLKGKDAAEFLFDFKKRVNDKVGIAFKEGQATKGNALRTISERFSKKVESAFAAAKAGDKYKATQKFWQDNVDKIERARKLAESDQTVEGLINKLSTGGRRNTDIKNFIDEVAEFVDAKIVNGVPVPGKGGKIGSQIKKNIDVLHSASMYGKWTPHMGILQSTAIATATAAKVAGATAVSTPAALAAGTQLSPRVLAKEVEILYRSKELLKSLGPKQLEQLLDNPKLFQQFVQTGIQAKQFEEDTKNNLLKAVGMGEASESGNPQ